jgi:tetratricopeptide (TPR) repeat protein
MGKQEPSWAERAEDLYQRRTFRSAALAFRVSLLQAPSSSKLMTMFARALEKVNPRSPFRHYARKATMLAPGEADTWYVFSQGALIQREFARATSAARRHHVLEPAGVEGILMLSRARFQRGEFEQCAHGLKRAATLAPDDKYVRIAQARCLFRQGRHGEALEASSQALERGADLVEFGFDHCRIAYAAGKRDMVAPLLDRLEKIDGAYTRKRQVLNLTVSANDLRAATK